MDGSEHSFEGLISSNAAAIVEALERPYAVIDFKPDGRIIRANENFLGVLGYTADEIAGQHHRMFLFQDDALSADYEEFWRILRRGDFHGGEFRRRHKSGGEVWISAFYVPIPDGSGEIATVRKYAIDITQRSEALKSVALALSKLATGDIMARLGDEVRGEYEPLRHDFNSAVSELEKYFRSLMGVAVRIGDSAKAANENAAQLSGRARAQEAELAKTSQSVNVISERVAENTAAAIQAEKLSRDTVEKAARGGEVVRKTVEAMYGIERITAEVGKISKVIENFAFQTNLLSINAAVEAARAGDAGRGFAVVAAEVRSLSQRSTEASKDIAKLIRESEQQVSEGVGLAQAAGDSLEEIGSFVTQVEAAVRNIAGASRLQGTAVRDVTEAVMQLENAVVGVTKLANEGAEQAQRLAADHRELDEFVDRFSTRGKGHGSPDYRGPDRRRADR